MSRDDRSALWLPSLVLFASLLGVAALALQPRPDHPVAAVFPPWWSAERAFAAAGSAGGAVLRDGAWSTLIVAQSPDPQFAARLRAAGALLVLDPQALGTCSTAVES